MPPTASADCRGAGSPIRIGVALSRVPSSELMVTGPAADSAWAVGEASAYTTGLAAIDGEPAATGTPAAAAQVTQSDESGIHTSGWVAPAAVQAAAKFAGSTALTVTWQSFARAATAPTASAISGAAATVNAQPAAADVPLAPVDPHR